MGCLFVIFVVCSPRFADIILWIARPNQFLAPFGGNWFWPLLGIIFLPFTTLMYVIMWTPESACKASTGSGSCWPCCWTSRTPSAVATPTATASRAMGPPSPTHRSPDRKSSALAPSR